MVPPLNPDSTEITPSSNWNCASTHQKHPAPNVAVSYLEVLLFIVLFFFMLSFMLLLFCAHEIIVAPSSNKLKMVPNPVLMFFGLGSSHLRDGQRAGLLRWKNYG